jgi:2-polyprenyl-3-methyl-5-hydroxy-6-metoxy-1,4-benzoquinol methylase
METKFDYAAVETGYYDRVYRKQKGAQSKWHWLKFQYMRDLLPKEGKLLDIACSAGTFIGSLDEGLDATGVDIAASQVDYASEHYGAPGKRFLQMDEGKLPFDDNTFDAVTVIELVEHLTVEQNRAILAEAWRVLKPKTGVLVVSTPNYHSGWPVLEILVNKLGELSYADQHITKFHRRRLADLLRGSGFHQVEARPYQGVAPFGAMLGWRFADFLYRIERWGLSGIYGFLLVATARK